MNKTVFRLLAAALILSAAACTSSKSLQGGKLERVRPGELWQQLDQGRLRYETFSARVKFSVEGEDLHESASADIRMLRDSLIWFSFRKVSIEGARVLITPDSILIIDRTNKEYFPFPYRFLAEEFGVDIPFSTLQDLVAGNVLLDKASGLGNGVDEDHHLLSANGDGRTYRFWMRTGDFQLQRMEVNDPVGDRSMTVVYEKWDATLGQPFAIDRLIALQNGSGPQERADLKLAFSKVRIDEELNFPFSVNPKYRVVPWQEGGMINLER